MENDSEYSKRKATRQPWEFLGVFLVIFFLISVFLFAIDFVPEAPSADSSRIVENAEAAVPVAAAYPVEEPVRIVIDSIGVDTRIENPTSTDLALLDQELLKGAVRYPTSAKLGEAGTVFLFGHQSYLPVVKNKAFKAFNELQKLKEGDTITVSSATAEYVYRVQSVALTTAEKGVVPLSRDGNQLILSTCNSISADHEERYVVEAELVSRRALDS
ncbi:MAG: sortase [Patescibacteria group bacterium]